MSRLLGFAPVDARGVLVDPDATICFAGAALDRQIFPVVNGDNMAVGFVVSGAVPTHVQVLAGRGLLAASVYGRRGRGVFCAERIDLHRDAFSATVWPAAVSMKSLPRRLADWPPRVALASMRAAAESTLLAPRQGRPGGTGTPVRVDVLGDVDETLARSVLEKIRHAGDSSLEVTIDSRGGSVGAGTKIYNALARHRCSVTTIVARQAQSMAAILFLSGDRRIIAPQGRLMLHGAGVELSGARLTASEMRLHARLLASETKRLAGIIAARTELDLLTAETLLADDDLVLTAQQAMRLGLATEITTTAAAEKVAIQGRQRDLQAARQRVAAEKLNNCISAEDERWVVEQQSLAARFPSRRATRR